MTSRVPAAATRSIGRAAVVGRSATPTTIGGTLGRTPTRFGGSLGSSTPTVSVGGSMGSSAPTIYGAGGRHTPTTASFMPPIAYGGMAINRGPGDVTNGGPGVVINRAPAVFHYGPSVIQPPAPQDPSGTDPVGVDTSAPWCRRYQAARDGYRDGGAVYGAGGYGPVFLYPGTSYYIRQVDRMYLNVTPPPIFVNGVDEQPQPLQAGPPEENADAPPPRHGQEPQAARLRASVRERRRTAARIAPEKLHELMIEGVKLFMDGKYDDAGSTFLRVTLADRPNADAALAYAVARFATGDYGIAGLAVRRGIRRMPEVVNSGFDVRTRYGRPQDFRDHLARLEHYLAEHPADEDAWMVIGFVRHFSGQRELARETFERMKDLPRADVQVAQIFLAADVQTVSQTQPAGPSLATMPASDAPLPPIQRAVAQQWISIDPPD